MDWTEFGEASFRPVLLSHYSGDAYAITGLAVFAVVPGQRFEYPGNAAAQLSRVLVDSGEVSSLSGFGDE